MDSPSSGSVEIEYYDNGYLKEDSIERLVAEQYLIKAVTAYELALPIASVQKWHRAFLKEAEYGD